MVNPIEQLIHQGNQARTEGRLPDALDAFKHAVEICRQAPDQVSTPEALSGLARIERDLNHLDSALKHYAEVEGICRQTEDETALAHTLRRSADVLRDLGRAEEAEAKYVEAIGLYEIQGPEVALDRANALRGLALLAQSRGQLDFAVGYWRQARDLYQHVGVQAGVDESYRRLRMLTEHDSSQPIV